MHNEYEKEEKYKLFRTVKEILHPTISKKNISNYKIIVDESILPLRVFYPNKVSNLKNVVIFVPGDAKITSSENKYSEVLTTLSKNLDKVVISLDYEDYKEDLISLQNKIYSSIKLIYSKLIEIGLTSENIILMGDSTGGSIILNVYDKINKDKLAFGSTILFYPILSGEYFGKTKYKSIEENNTINHDLIKKLKRYYSSKLKKEEYTSGNIFPLQSRKRVKYQNTTILTGNTDPLIDETKDFCEKHNIILNIIDFAYHGFLNTTDNEIIKEYNEVLNNFLSNKNN